MTDAQSAIIDIQDSLEEYGTQIKFNHISISSYNPITDTSSETITTEITKAFIKKSATAKVGEDFRLAKPNDSYDYAIMMYSITEPHIDDTIEDIGIIDFYSYVYSYVGTYKVVWVSPTILQGSVIKYEVLVKS